MIRSRSVAIALQRFRSSPYAVLLFKVNSTDVGLSALYVILRNCSYDD